MVVGVVDQVGFFCLMGAYRRCKGVDESAGTGDRSDMRKHGIGENTGTGDRSAADIFAEYRRGYYG